MHKITKNILKIMLIILLCLYIPVISKAYTSQEVGQAFATYAEKVVTEGNQKGILRYSQRASHRNAGFNWQKVTDSEPQLSGNGSTGEVITGTIAFDCSSFCSRVYDYVSGGIFGGPYSTRDFSSIDCIEEVSLSNLQVGDILWRSGHCEIYLGGNKTAAASTFKNRSHTEQVVIKDSVGNFTKAYRLKDEYIAQITTLNTDVDWTAVGESPTSGSRNNTTSEFYYNGLAKKVEFREYQSPIPSFSRLTELTDYLIGAMTLGVKIQLIGWTAIFENAITDVVEGITGTPVVAEDVTSGQSDAQNETVVPAQSKLNATEAGNAIANYAKDLVENHQSEFVYSYGEDGAYKGGREDTYRGVKTSGWAYGNSNHYDGAQFEFTDKYSVDGEGFVNIVIHQSLGIGGTNYTKFTSASQGFENIGTSTSDLKAGDIIHFDGHYAIYLGDGNIAHAMNKGAPTPETWTIYIDSLSDYSSSGINGIYRITETKAAQIDPNNVSTELRTTTTSMENLEVPRNIEDKLTIEKIIYNKVPLLDVNIFNFKDAAEMELTPENVIYIIKQNVANWYYTFRNITIIGLLLVLIYIGLRMALSTIASDKAKYTKLFVNWLVSFVIVFFIHYFMLAVLLINENLVSLISEIGYQTEEVEILKLVEDNDENGNPILDENGNPVKVLKKVKVEITTETSLYNSIFEKAYEIKASQGIAGTIMYMFLVYYLLKFLFVYFKRLLTVNILALISPLIAISYAIDKIKDNKSQALGTWMREFSSNVLIQFMHALLYYIFVSVAFDLVFSTSLGGIIVGFVFLHFMLKAESLLYRMFKFGGSTGSLKNLMDSTNEFVGGALAVRAAGGSIVNLGAKGASQVGKAIPAVQKTEMYRSAVNHIQRSRIYRNTLGRADGGISDDMLVDNISESARVATRNARKANWKAIKGATKTGRKIISNSASFAFSIPQLVANPELGVQNLIRTSMELKRLLGDAEKLKIGRKYAGQKFTVRSKVGRTVLGVATLGTSEVIRGLSNVSQKQLKEAKKVEEKYVLAYAYRDALHLEKKLIADVIKHSDIESKYIDMVKKGESHTQVLPEDIKGVTVRNMTMITPATEKIAEVLEKNGIEVDKKQLEKNIEQEFVNALTAVAIANTPKEKESATLFARARYEDEKQRKQKVEEILEKNAKGVHVNNLTPEQATSLARYQVIYNENYVGSGESAKQSAITALESEKKGISGQLRELENQLQELQEQIKIGQVGNSDLEVAKSLEKRITELKIDRQMVETILQAQDDTEKVVLIDNRTSHRILKVAEKGREREEKEKLEAEIVAEEILHGMSKEDFKEYTYRVLLRTLDTDNTQIEKLDVEKATEDYINDIGEQEPTVLTQASAAEIVENIMKENGIRRDRKHIQSTAEAEALYMAQHIINGQLKKEQEKEEGQVIKEYSMLQEESDISEVAKGIDPKALRQVESVLYRMQQTEEITREDLEKVISPQEVDSMLDTVSKTLKTRDIAKLIYSGVEKDGSYHREELPQEYENMRQTVERLNEINTYTRERIKKKVVNTDKLVDNILQVYGKSQKN